MSQIDAILRLQIKEDVSANMRKVRAEMEGLNKTAKTSQNSVKLLFQQFGVPLSLAAGVTALALFAQGSVKAASALTELNSKAGVVFDETFDQIVQKSRDVGDEVGRASSAILQMSTDMGAIIKAFGITGPLMDKMSVQLAKLAVDMASFHNTTDEQAFMALRSGLSGETEPLKRFGIVLTDTNLKFFALDKGIKQSVESMNQAQKTALRYEFILDKTKDSQGDAARTADSFANQSRRLSGEMQMLQEEMGEAATPVLADVLGVIATAIQKVRPYIKSLTTDFANLFDTIGNPWGIGLEMSVGAADVQEFSEDVLMSVGAQAEMAEATDDATGSLKDQIESLKGAGGASDSTGKKAEDLRETMEDLGETFADVSKDSESGIRGMERAHKEAMRSITEESDRAKSSLQELDEQYARTVRDIKREQQSLDTGKAEAYGDQLNLVADLRKKLEAKQAEALLLNAGGQGVSLSLNDDIADLKAQLAREQAALDSAPLSAGVKLEGERRADLTEFQKKIGDLADRQGQLDQKRADEEADYQKQRVRAQDDLKALEDKKRLEEETYTLQRQQYQLTINALDVFHTQYTAALDDMASVTEADADHIGDALAQIRDAMSEIDSDATYAAQANIDNPQVIERRNARLPRRASGGLSGGYTLVGEFGPEVVSLPQGSYVHDARASREMASGGINITFGPVTVRQESDIRAIADKIVRTIQLQKLQSS